MNKTTGEPGVMRGITNFFGRTAVGVAGVSLMILGVAMGVTLVMLPVGIGIGLAGVALLAGALMVGPETKRHSGCGRPLIPLHLAQLQQMNEPVPNHQWHWWFCPEGTTVESAKITGQKFTDRVEWSVGGGPLLFTFAPTPPLWPAGVRSARTHGLFPLALPRRFVTLPLSARKSRDYLPGRCDAPAEVRTMSGTLTIRDETLSGEPLREWALEVTAEKLTVRELIRSRVYQEVQDYNLKRGLVFQGLVQPEEAEKTLNGWKLKKPRVLDWKRQFERAVEAFEKNQILILVNDRQAESLDEEFVIESQTRGTFSRLTLLVGG